MKKIAALLIMAVLLVSACTAAFAEPVTIAVIYSDTVDDKGWCQAMHDGIQKAIELGYEIDYTPIESVEVPNAKSTLDQLVGDYDVILVHGAQFKNACAEVAAENPDQVFALGTDTSILGDNVFTYMPQSEEPGYVNGVIAATTTRNNAVGVVGSADNGDSARFIRGFLVGVKDTNPDCVCRISLTGSFSDTAGAGSIAQTLIAAGCDVLTGSSQQALGGIRVAQGAENVTWLGQTFTQLNDFPGVVVAAADYDYSSLLVSILNEMNAGVTGGKCIPLNFSNQGFVYAFSENLSDEAKAAGQAAIDKLAAQADSLLYCLEMSINE